MRPLCAGRGAHVEEDEAAPSPRHRRHLLQRWLWRLSEPTAVLAVAAAAAVVVIATVFLAATAVVVVVVLPLLLLLLRRAVDGRWPRALPQQDRVDVVVAALSLALLAVAVERLIRRRLDIRPPIVMHLIALAAAEQLTVLLLLQLLGI